MVAHCNCDWSKRYWLTTAPTGLQGLFSHDGRADVFNKEASKFCFSGRRRTVEEVLAFAKEQVAKMEVTPGRRRSVVAACVAASCTRSCGKR